MATKKTTTKKKTSARQAATKKAAPTKATDGEKVKRGSAIDAAAKVLAETKQAMNCKELIEAMSTKGYWTSPGGKTPASTLYAAILREINAKGSDSRFTKIERGQFAVKA